MNKKRRLSEAIQALEGKLYELEHETVIKHNEIIKLSSDKRLQKMARKVQEGESSSEEVKYLAVNNVLYSMSKAS